jgi:5-methylcytosine-specific restriction endonuclease McrA
MVHKDKEQYRAYMKEYMLKRYNERREKAIEKLGGKCVKCGSTQHLQFDHINPEDKSFTIAVRSSINEKDFWKEIDKCQLLCLECHQQKTITDMGMKPAKGFHGTLSSYRYCRCNLCKKAKSDYMKTYVRKDRKKKGV